MNYLNPIYTEKRNCQDCYKCLRNCPVKAIKVEGGYARILPEECLICGHCVEVCPNGAKVVRDDLSRARQLVAANRQVMVSLAPSFVSEFPGALPGQLIRALKALGFMGVSETALGAQQVSAGVAELIARQDSGVYISSACPAVVAYLEKHRPANLPQLTGLLSPLLTHCKMLKASLGPDVRVVFFGPCIAKKSEADAHPELLEAALTFADLRRWLAEEKIPLETLTARDEDRFIPERSAEGAWYPVDGGMIAGIKSHCAVNDGTLMSFSGFSAIQKALQGLEDMPADRAVFLELLACEGGCINGPKMTRPGATVAKRSRVLTYGQYPAAGLPRPVGVEMSAAYPLQTRSPESFSDVQIREALRAVGKFNPEDELNCGGCGYDSCREFGKALLRQKAERAMCVTYMRELAHKKANALLQKMPSAVVIVNDALQVLEANATFARLFARDVRGAEETPTLLEATSLGQLVPFANLFASVLKTGEDIVDRDLRFRETILHLSIFTIEKHCVVGGIIQDVTKPAVQKEQVIQKAQEVIRRNLATVQKIAYLLGENASESEITLNSIIDSFTPPKLDEHGAAGDWKKLYQP